VRLSRALERTLSAGHRETTEYWTAGQLLCRHMSHVPGSNLVENVQVLADALPQAAEARNSLDVLDIVDAVLEASVDDRRARDGMLVGPYRLVHIAQLRAGRMKFCVSKGCRHV
jgi:hypothetical protein